MDQTIFLPAPNWFHSKVISAREDGSVAYGSMNGFVILKSQESYKFKALSLIKSENSARVTAVAFSPSNCSDILQNTLISCSDDGCIKLWKLDTLSVLKTNKSHWDSDKQVGKIISLDWSIANPHHIISAADNNSLVLWDVYSNTTVKYSFPKLFVTTIACCPFRDKMVAAGVKSGLVLILNLVGNGEILFRFRGHDNAIDSLSWCPVPYNVFIKNEIHEEFLLASSCQNKEVFIWRAGSGGKYEAKFHSPTSSISKKNQHSTKLGNSFSFLNLFWSDPYTIYLSSDFGEVIYFDIKAYLSNKPLEDVTSTKKLKKHSLDSLKLYHSLHSKALNSISGTPVQGQLVVSENIQFKSELKLKIEANNMEIIKRSTNQEYDSDENESMQNWEIILPKTSPLLWSTGQDRKLIACKTVLSNVEIVHNLSTMSAFIYCAVGSPYDPNKIAIGVGDGPIRLWNLTEPSGEVHLCQEKIKGRVMCLAWHPSKDGLLAYGTHEGRLGLVDTNSNKQLRIFKPGHFGVIYSISWGPQFQRENLKDDVRKIEYDLYSVGDNTLFLHSTLKLNADALNLTEILQFSCKKQTDVCWKPDYSVMAVGNEDGSVYLVEPKEFNIVYALKAYSKLIQSMAWHPAYCSLDSDLSPYHGYFTSGSTDNSNEIRVFNFTESYNEFKVEQVASLKGHEGYIQSVSWSPHKSGQLVSTSKDSTVRIWDVITQSTLNVFTPHGRDGNILFSLWSPINSDIMLTGGRNHILTAWKISTYVRDHVHFVVKMKKTKKSATPQIGSETEVTDGNSKKKEKNKFLEGGDKISQKGSSDIAIAEAKTNIIHSKEIKMFSKVWKIDSNDSFKNCYCLLKTNSEDLSEFSKYSLPFLNNDDCYRAMVKTEEESFEKSNSWTELYQLSLWNGNIKEVIEEKIKTGQLNDFLVTLAPTVSPRLWQEACLSYSKTLVENKLYRKAATYLIVCHKIYEAIQLLLDANLYLEALCIAKSRLPKSDPAFTNILTSYAQRLVKDGAFEKACECFIYLKDYRTVANILGRKNKPEHLSLAALAARKFGATDIQCMHATNALLKCFREYNFELAELICCDHENLMYLKLLNYIHHLIYKLDAGKTSIDEDIITFVRKSYNPEDIVIPSPFLQLYRKNICYKDRSQVSMIVGQELFFACCSKDMDEILTHLIKALSACYRLLEVQENEIPLLFKVCTWIAPQGFVSDNSYFSLKEINTASKVKSLRAFLCAAIVNALGEQAVESFIEKIAILRELIHDLMDADTYNYYKNLIELKLCEERLLSAADHANSDVELTNGIEAEKSEEKDTDSNMQLEKDSVTNNSNCQDSINYCEGDVAENIKNENGFESSCSINLMASPSETEKKDEQLIVETVYEKKNKILEEKDLLKKLTDDIENFERIRISSPNPVPICFWVKKLCEKFSESNEIIKSFFEEFKKISENFIKI